MGIAGVLASSPFWMLLRSVEAEAASRLTMPLSVTYATTPINERATVAKVAEATPPECPTLHAPEVGAQGAVSVMEHDNPNGWEANWAAVEAFLNRVAPSAVQGAGHTGQRPASPKARQQTEEPRRA